MNVGFIGLGGMGQGMAARILAAGHRLHVWNRSPEAAEPLVANGAVRAETPIDAAQGDLLCSMLADDAAIHEVIIDSALLQDVKPGLVFVNHATISVALAQELERRCAAHNVGYVSAPVFGRPDAAAGGKLHILAAGDPAAVATVLPVLEAMSQRVWQLGAEPERANAVKLAGNFLIAATIEQLGEALALGERYGVARRDMVDVLTGTLFGAPVYVNYGSIVSEKRYEPAGFKLRHGAKDIRLVLAAGDAVDQPLPIASLLRDRFLEALGRGEGERDWSAIAER